MLGGADLEEKDATCMCLACLSQSTWRGEKRCKKGRRETERFQRATCLEPVPKAVPGLLLPPLCSYLNQKEGRGLHKCKSQATGPQRLAPTLPGEDYLGSAHSTSKHCYSIPSGDQAPFFNRWKEGGLGVKDVLYLCVSR